MSNYIEASLASDGNYTCKRYDGNGDNPKKRGSETLYIRKKDRIQLPLFSYLTRKT